MTTFGIVFCDKIQNMHALNGDFAMNEDLMIMAPETLQNEVCGCDRKRDMCERDGCVDNEIKTPLKIRKHMNSSFK